MNKALVKKSIFVITEPFSVERDSEVAGSISIDAVVAKINGELGWRSHFVGDSWIHF